MWFSSRSLLCLFGTAALFSSVSALEAGVPDSPFLQEVHEAFPVGQSGDSNDVRAITVDPQGRVWAGTKAGPFVLNPKSKVWSPALSEDRAGPVFDLFAARDGSLWMAAWDGLYRARGDRLEPLPAVDQPVAALCETDRGIHAFGPSGGWLVSGLTVTEEPLRISKSIRALLPGAEGNLWVATGMGLYDWNPVSSRLYQSNDEIYSSAISGLAYASDASLWVGSLGGISIFRHGKWIETLTPEQGLPSAEVRCVAKGPDDRMWVGTSKGIARFKGEDCSVRHSRRWLLDDDVRDIAFDREGTAWVATAGGVSAIRSATLTLAEKADYYLKVLYERHVREPWFVEKCRLQVPGDLSTWAPEDDDNDGEYTGNYLVMESFRYAVTQDPEAKRNADRAFEALKRLETIDDIPGFFARTIIPATWEHMHDPNRTYTDRQLAEAAVEDPRFKPVEVRWRPSADGKWLWKGDTSSDEMTGHFFAYHYYHDLAADEASKTEVADHVARIMDHLIEHDYCLVDVDGKHTRWGVWSPDRLANDPDWRAERNINATELLSYLKTTHALTGNEKYQEAYRHLIQEKDFLDYAQEAKTYARAWNTRIDDSLLVEAFPGLMKYETDPRVKAVYRQSLDHWFDGVQDDCNPFFNFVYGSLVGGDPHLDKSIEFLRDTPLDLINWSIDNRGREDLRLVRKPLLEVLSTDRLLPSSERGVVRWDKNPWEAVQGDGGQTEWAPTFWLMPYWIGRYYGFIDPPGLEATQ